MRQFLEFRVAEEHAHLLFGYSEGTRLGTFHTVRKIVLPVDDPRIPQIRRVEDRLKANGHSLYSGCFIHYRYTRSEIAAAELFFIWITAAFEPPGELCGTVFDESETCPECGAGRKQVSDLVLDLRKAPKTKDIAGTIARDEWLISQRLAELMVDAKLTGFDLAPVRHKARYQDDPVDIKVVPTGREMYRLAKAQGVPDDRWEFDVWVHRPEQAELLDRAWEEHAELRARQARKHRKPPPVWYQLVVTSNPVPMVAPTRAGNDPFDDDPKDEYRCPYGHVIGLTLLSEVSVPRNQWDGSDVIITSNMTGCRRGLLMPAPRLLISPRFYQLLRKEKIKGFKAEIAHLV